jgi:hypothetical protein
MVAESNSVECKVTASPGESAYSHDRSIEQHTNSLVFSPIKCLQGQLCYPQPCTISKVSLHEHEGMADGNEALMEQPEEESSSKGACTSQNGAGRETSAPDKNSTESPAYCSIVTNPSDFQPAVVYNLEDHAIEVYDLAAVVGSDQPAKNSKMCQVAAQNAWSVDAVSVVLLGRESRSAAGSPLHLTRSTPPVHAPLEVSKPRQSHAAFEVPSRKAPIQVLHILSTTLRQRPYPPLSGFAVVVLFPPTAWQHPLHASE